MASTATELMDYKRQQVTGDSPGHLSVWLGRLVSLFVGLSLVVLLAATIGPRVLPYRTFTVLSGSMEPTIPVGAMIFDRQVDATDLAVGDVITFHPPTAPEKLVSHRIEALQESPDGPVLVTKGDANSVRDGWRIPATGEGLRYQFHIPYLGYLVGSMLTPMGRFVVLVVGSLWLGGRLLWSIWRSDESPEER